MDTKPTNKRDIKIRYWGSRDPFLSSVFCCVFAHMYSIVFLISFIAQTQTHVVLVVKHSDRGI